MRNEIYRKYKWWLLFFIPASLIFGALKMGIYASISNAMANSHGSFLSIKLFMILLIVLSLLGLLIGRMEAKVFSLVNRDIQTKLINRVIDTPYVQLEKIGLPKIVTTLSEDTKAAERYFHVLPGILTNTVMILCGFIYLVYLSSTLFILSLSFLCITFATGSFLISYSKKYRVDLRDNSDKLNDYYQSIVLGAKEINLNLKRKRVLRSKILSTINNVQNKTKNVLNIDAMTEQSLQILILMMLGSIIYVAGGYLEVKDEVVIGYVLTLLFLAQPIMMVIGSSIKVLDAKVAFNKIESLGLCEVTDEYDDSKFEEPLVVNGKSLVLSNVVYSYSKHENNLEEFFTLGPISAQFNPGQATLIIGGNGSGKSTLLKVLCGLYPKDSGSIYFGESSTASISNGLDCFSYIAPDFWLFEDVLDDKGEIPEAGIIYQYLKDLMLTHAVSEIKGRLSTLDLSQGQRKRLALLQIYLEDKPIVILDEWAADQDPAFKKVFYDEIIPSLKQKGKIVIFVSHDDNYYLSSADQILKLNEGKLHRVS